MSCFSCFSSQEKRASRRFDSARQPSPSPSPDQKNRELNKRSENQSQTTRQNAKSKPGLATARKNEACNGNIEAQTFTFRELASATKNFRADNLLGEGGFGRVYKGYLNKAGHLVAVKQLDRSGLQGNKEFVVEVLTLSLLHHQNLVNLVGYCADGAQRLLVYEFMPLGSLEDHLLDIDPDQKPLSWYNRMKIALGAAKGLEYLHEKANPPIIFRDLKSSNILLNENYDAKLSDFGLAKLGPVGDKLHGSSRVMGTYGYCAPEYASSGQITLKSDVFSFGVVLLELITGRRAIDATKPTDEQNLVSWAQPLFKDTRRYCELADPLLEGDYPEIGLNEAVAVSAMCVQEEATVRPLMTDIVETLTSHLASSTERSNSSHHHRPPSSAIKQQAEDEGCVLDANGKAIDLGRQRAVAEAIVWGSEFKAHKENPP